MSRVVIRKTGPQMSKANRNRIELDWSAANPEMVPKTSHFHLWGIVGILLSIGYNNSDKRSVNRHHDGYAAHASQRPSHPYKSLL